MRLITGSPIISPSQGERLMAALWQQTAGTSLALLLVGRGEPEPMLATVSPNHLVEDDCAEAIARAVNGSVTPGFLLSMEVLAAPNLAVRHITPTYRGFQTNTKSWGWDRADNLHDTYELLGKVQPGLIAGFALAFRTLPQLRAATAMAVFAAGPTSMDTERLAFSLAATYAGTGARVSRLLNPRRFLRRALQARVSTSVSWFRPHSVIRAEEMSAFWHPRLNEKS